GGNDEEDEPDVTHRWPWLLAWSLIIVQPACAQHARPGIDVLLSDSARLIEGKRIGLITNQSGIDARGVSTIDRLANTNDRNTEKPSYTLVELFAPEHGIRGRLAPGTVVADERDSATNLPIYSLYGANRAPTPSQMASLD